jgi:hypothetical protein
LILMMLVGAFWVTGRCSKTKSASAVSRQVHYERAVYWLTVTMKTCLTSIGYETVSNAGAVVGIPTPVGAIEIKNALGLKQLNHIVALKRQSSFRQDTLRHLRNHFFAGTQLKYWRGWIDMHLAGAVIGCWRGVKEWIASAPIWNEIFVHRIRIYILSFDVANIFDPLLRRAFPTVHLGSINSATEFTQRWETTKNHSRPVLLMILEIVNPNSDRYDDCTDNCTARDYLVGVEHLVEPPSWWGRVLGGT